MKKSRYLFLSFYILLLPACDEEQFIEDTVGNLNTQDQGFSYSLQFEAPYPHYNGENMTRATSTGEWEDGDEVYLFLGGENEAYANATYNKEHNIWTLHSDKMLEACGVTECIVWYGNGGGSITLSEEGFVYDYLREAYYTESGQYSFQEGEIYVIAELKPFARRLRFKGKPGTEIMVQGKGMLSPYNNIARFGETGFILSDKKNWTLQVGFNGYTDYCVFEADATTTVIIIVDSYTKYTYSRYFDKKLLKDGESGCFSIPTQENPKGWNLDQPYPVDLGLPSGLHWANSNVGAARPEDYGYYFAWGETEAKEYYDQSTYKLYKKDWTYDVETNTNLTFEEDAAHVIWGGGWRIPTIEEFEELVTNCAVKDTIQNGVNVVEYTGPNGNSIFLPRAGNCSYSDHNSGFFYWSSTYAGKGYWDSDHKAYYKGTGGLFSTWCYLGGTIRPVSY